MNISNGLNLAGFNTNALTSVFNANNSNIAQAQNNSATNIPQIDGKQIVDMKVVGYQYSPSEFNVVQGIPVEWRIDGAQAAGCGQVLTVPSLGITELLPKQGIKTVNFTPREAGDISFNCSMGMMTRGAAFHVLPNNNSQSISLSNASKTDQIN